MVTIVLTLKICYCLGLLPLQLCTAVVYTVSLCLPLLSSLFLSPSRMCEILKWTEHSSDRLRSHLSWYYHFVEWLDTNTLGHGVIMFCHTGNCEITWPTQQSSVEIQIQGCVLLEDFKGIQYLSAAALTLIALFFINISWLFPQLSSFT